MDLDSLVDDILPGNILRVCSLLNPGSTAGMCLASFLASARLTTLHCVCPQPGLQEHVIVIFLYETLRGSVVFSIAVEFGACVIVIDWRRACVHAMLLTGKKKERPLFGDIL